MLAAQGLDRARGGIPAVSGVTRSAASTPIFVVAAPAKRPSPDFTLCVRYDHERPRVYLKPCLPHRVCVLLAGHRRYSIPHRRAHRNS
jgi:hypothetical protein